jgi:DNA-binding transcriptional ArsR family regulator
MEAKPFKFIPEIPWWWFVKASSLPGKAYSVGCLIWLCHRLSTSKKFPVRFSRRYYGPTNLSRYTVRSGLKNLEQAGLIKVKREEGKSKAPLVTIITKR